MLARKIKETLAAGRVSVGTWMSIGHVSIAEILASAGFEWVVVETEHTAIDVSEVLRLIIAIEAGGSIPLVRLAGIDPLQAKAVMDSGAAGVIVPMITSKVEAEAAVRSVKYPPLGARGVGVARAHGYGAHFDEYLRTANDETIVVAQIEHIDAVRRIDEILSVTGLDATFIGPYDLSASMGLAGQLDHPDVVAAMRRVLRATRAKGVAPGIHIVRAATAAEELLARVDEGYRFIAVGSDLFLLGHTVRELAALTRTVAQDRPE